MGTELTSDEMKLYTTISEEAAEVIHIISKIIRFGEDDINPNTGDYNTGLLEDELTDLIAVIELAKEYGLNVPDMNKLSRAAIEKKKVKVVKYNKLPLPPEPRSSWWD